MEVVNERYELQSIAGKGGQAVVYKALDRQTDTLVAVKKVDMSSSRQDDLEREVHILRALKHKNIVSFLDECRTKSHMYIVLEYAALGSLLSILKQQAKQATKAAATALPPSVNAEEPSAGNSEGSPNTAAEPSTSAAASPAPPPLVPSPNLLGLVVGEKRFTDSASANYLTQVLEGLKYLHEQGILHRDIKAANVLLNSNSVVKLTDFGLATSISQRASPVLALGEGIARAAEDEDGAHDEHSHKPNNVVGSVYWMAPENIKGETVTEASDIWSLGCLAVELLTGSPPFYDRTPANALYCIAESKTIPLPGNLSRGATDFISRCLKPNAADRLSAAQLLSHPWIVSGGTNTVADMIDNEFSFSVKVDTALPNDTTQSSSKGGVASPTSLDDIMSGIHSPQMQLQQAIGSTSQLPIASPKIFDPENVAAFLEAKLFANENNELDVWLRDYSEFQKCVAALSHVTAEESFRIVRALYYAADQLRNHDNGQFYIALGNTSLWDHDLLVMASIESLAPLFIFSCCFQDPSPELVPQYTASNKRALQLVLRSDFAAACIDAIYCIVTGSEAAYPYSPVSDDMRSIGSDRSGSGTATSQQLSPASPLHNSQPRPPPALNELPNGNNSPQPAAATTNSSSGAFGKGALAATVVPCAQEAFRQLSSARRAAIRRRFELDNAAETIANLVEDMTAASFSTKTDPALGWDTVERLFAIIAALTGDKPLLRTAITDRWIIALLEGSNHRCPSAISMYARLAREHTDLVARSMTVSTFLNIVVDSQTVASLKAEVMECFPVLQANDERCAAVLEDRSTTVPLLAMALNMTPLNCADYATPVLARLCERPAMAAACASYQRFIPTAVSKMHRAMETRNAVEMRYAVRLAQLMFAHSENPQAFIISQQLNGTLAIATQHYQKIFPKDVTRGVAELLDAMGEHSCIA